MATPGNEFKSIIKKIPGFRSGTPWKMIVASFVYLAILLALIGAMIPSEQIEDVFDEEDAIVLVKSIILENYKSKDWYRGEWEANEIETYTWRVTVADEGAKWLVLSVDNYEYACPENELAAKYSKAKLCEL